MRKPEIARAPVTWTSSSAARPTVSWQLGYNAFNTTPWTGWRQEGNSWTSDPGVVCRAGTGIVDVFRRGDDNALFTVSEPAS